MIGAFFWSNIRSQTEQEKHIIVELIAFLHRLNLNKLACHTSNSDHCYGYPVEYSTSNFISNKTPLAVLWWRRRFPSTREFWRFRICFPCDDLVSSICYVGVHHVTQLFWRLWKYFL